MDKDKTHERPCKPGMQGAQINTKATIPEDVDLKPRTPDAGDVSLDVGATVPEAPRLKPVVSGPSIKTDAAIPGDAKIKTVEPMLSTHADTKATIPGDANIMPGAGGRKKPSGLSYAELYEIMNPYKAETPEEKAKREKKEKWQKIGAAISDGVGALAGLWAASSSGARSAYDPNNSLSEKTRQRLDKLKAEREANHKQYMEGYMRARQMDEANLRDDRSWKHQLEREKVTDGINAKRELRAEQKERQNELMFQLRMALQQNKVDESGYRALEAEIRAGRLNELTDARISAYNRQGRSKPAKEKEYPYTDRDGKEHKASTSKAAEYNAKYNGTWVDDTQNLESETKKTEGHKTTSTKSKRQKSNGGHPASPQELSSRKKPGIKDLKI